MLERDPGSALAANNLAMLLVEYRETDPASMQRARELAAKLTQSTNPAYLDTVGWVEYKFKDYAKAVDYLKRAVDAAPNSAIMRYHLGMAHLAQGNAVEALDNLKQAVNANVKFRGEDVARAKIAELEAG
jgi:predicted Zn-dependent protease